MRLIRSAPGAAALFASGLISSTSLAQQASGFGISRFDPSERGSEWFALDTLDLRGSVRPSVGVVGEYQDQTLVVLNPVTGARTSVLGDLFIVHPGASLVLADRLRVAASLPLQLYANGQTATVGSQVFSAPRNDQALGDLRFGADVRLFGVYGEPITVAAGVQLGLPTGNRDAYAGDGAVRVTPHLNVAGDVSIIAYAAKVGYQYRYHSESFGPAPVGSELTFGGSIGLRVLAKKLLFGPEVFGTTVTDGGHTFEKRTTPVEGLLGAHYTAGDFRFGGGVGTGLTTGYGTPRTHVLASLEWAPRAITDRDSDGIRDGDDACPDVVGIHTDDAKTNGCPAPPPPPPDRDGDSVLDADDACPDEAGIRTGDPKTHGCPEKAPEAPPVEKDTDEDGILDREDACPAEKGVGDPDPKKNGCPKLAPFVEQIRVLEQVRFKSNSAELETGKDSLDVLKNVLKVFSDHPEVKRVSIEGHTDTRGSAEGNKALSAARAASVMKWLVAHGVDASRLTSAGFGQERPVDSNSTDEGRARNRRVEFRVVEEDKN